MLGQSRQFQSSGSQFYGYSSDFTVSLWLYVSREGYVNWDSNSHTLFAFSSNIQLTVAGYSSNKLVLNWYSSIFDTGLDIKLFQDVWTHLVFRIDSNNWYLYVNGVLSQSFNHGRGAATGNWGTFYVGGGDWRASSIDDFRLYSRQLSNAEIMWLYNPCPVEDRLYEDTYVCCGVGFTATISGCAPANAILFSEVYMCNNGYTGSNGGMCTGCVTGKYKDAIGDANCSKCSIGTYSEVISSSNCVPCEVGKFSVVLAANTSSVCTACPTYSNSPTSSSVSVACTCNMGYTGANGGVCAACVAGKYKTNSGSDLCTGCDVDTYSTELGASTSSTCLQCAVDSFSSSSSSSCTFMCRAGTTGLYGTCTSCAAGKYKTTPGSAACTNCGLHTYSESLGASASSTCMTCPVDSYSPSSSSSIVACVPGCPVGMTGLYGSCTNCVAGTYKMIGGPSECTKCDVNTYSLTVGANSYSTCVACPGNSTSVVGSSIFRACWCIAGYMMFPTSSNFQSCAICPSGKYQPYVGQGGCYSCTSGTYSLTLGATVAETCLACPVNTWKKGGHAGSCVCDAGYQGADGGPCLACIAGKYKTSHAWLVGIDVCTDCGVDTYSSTIAAGTSDTCVACPVNTKSVNGSSSLSMCIVQECVPGSTGPDGGVCSACVAGKYKAVSGSVACSDCSIGKYSETVGATASSACVDCPVNSNSAASSAICTCNAGSSGPNGGVCSTCVAGKYKTSPGSVACTDCGTATYSAEVGASASSTCSTCPSNSNAPSSSSAALACTCNAGFTYANTNDAMSGTCTACVAGKYKAVSGSNGCSDCSAGTYLTTVGATAAGACVACPANSYSGAVGANVSSTCTCNTGYTGSDGGVCSPCSPGSFKTQTGSAACALCPNNTFSAEVGRNSSCVSCQANAVSASGSVSQNFCYCKIGYAHAVGMSTCRICDPGTYNSQLGRTACSNCSVGLYSVNYGAIGSEVCLSCPLGQWSPEGSPNCNLCPANSRAGVGSGSRTSCICDAGYTGPAGSTCTSCVAGTYKAATGSGLCSACPALASTSGPAKDLSDCWCVTGYIKVSGVCKPMVPRAVAVMGSLAGVSVNSSVSYLENATNALRASIALRLNISIDLVQIDRVFNSTNVRVSIFGRSETELNIVEGQIGLAMTVSTITKLPFTLSTRNYTNTSVLAATRAVVIGGSLLNLSTTANRRLLLQSSDIVVGSLVALRLEISRLYNVSLSTVRVNFDGLSTYNTLPLTVTIDIWSENELQTVRNVSLMLQLRGKLVLENSMVFLINGTQDAGPCGLNFTSALVRADGVPMTLAEVQSGSTLSALKTQLSMYYGVPESAVEVTVVQVDGVYSVQTVVRAVQPVTVESLQQKFAQSSPSLNVASVTLALPFQMTNMDVSYVSVPAGSGVSMPNAVSIQSELVYADGTALSSSEVAQAADTLILQMSRFYGVDTSLVQVEIIPPRNPAVSNASSVRVVIRSGVQTVDDVFQRAEQMPATAAVHLPPVAIAGLDNAQTTVLQGQMVEGRFVECAANYRVYNATCQCSPGYMLQPDLSTCVACAAGKSSAGVDSTACTDCPPNTFSGGASTACRDCHANAVSSAASASVDACACIAGYFFFLTLLEKRVCLPCAVGSYKSAVGNVNCTACWTGSSVSVGGSSEQACCPADSTVSNEPLRCLCNPRYTGPADGPCGACAVGKYKNTTSTDACAECTAGSFSDVNGSTGCALCPANTFSGAGAERCSACPNLTQSAGGSNASSACECVAGYTGAGGMQPCTSCAAGTYKTVAGSGACTPCPTRTFSGAVGSSTSQTCTACHPNATSAAGSPSKGYCYCEAGFAQVNGTTWCALCNPGKYNTQLARTACSNCTVGLYAAGYGSKGVDSCFACPAGQWSPEGSPDCKMCPVNSAAPARSGLITNCICDAGFTGPNGGPCVACVAGKYKVSNGSAACSSCPANANSLLGSTNVNDCSCNSGYTGPNVGPCVACAAGTAKNTSGTATCGVCPVNTYAASAALTCTSCPAGFLALPGMTTVQDCCGLNSRPQNSTICTPVLANVVASYSTTACARFIALTPKPSFASISTRNNVAIGTLPTYNAVGGPNGRGHVSFDRTKSQYLDAGTRTLNIATNGGFTIVAVVRFTSTSATWERILDMGSGPDQNNIVFSRLEGGTGFIIEARNGGSSVARTAFDSNVITQNAWLTVVASYRISTRVCSLTINGVLATTTGSTTLTDRTNSLNFMGRSNWGSDPFLSADLAGVFVVDEFLGTDATTAIYNAMIDGVDLTSTTCGEIKQICSSTLGCSCNTGYTGPETGASKGQCSICPVGTYKSTNGSAACTNCTANANSLLGSKNVNNCLCNSGYTGPDVGPCVACAAGTVKNMSGSAACSTCPADTFTDSYAVACTQCPVGFKSLPGTTTSTDCCGLNSSPRNITICPIINQDPLGSILVTSPAYLMTSAEAWDAANTRFTDLSGNGRHGVLTAGAVTIGSDTGNGAGLSIPRVQGTDQTSIYWGAGSIPSTFTVCSITRYSGAFKQRILQCNNMNWLHGHFGGKAGATHYNGQGATESYSISPNTNWVVVCGRNIAGTVASVIANGVVTCTGCRGVGDCNLCININGQSSDWQLSRLYVWDRHLTDTEFAEASVKLNNYVAGERPRSCVPSIGCSCNTGYTGPETDASKGQCSICPAGTYKPTNGTAACTSCTANANSSLGSKNVSDCSCNPGYTGPDVGPCAACAAGKFKNASGSAGCDVCPANSYSVSARTNVRDCSCNPGYTGPNAGPCLACLPGQYKRVLGTSACITCPPNTEAPGAATAVCASLAGFSGLGYALEDVSRSCGSTLTETCATLSNGATTNAVGVVDGALDGNTNTFVSVAFNPNLARSCGKSGADACVASYAPVMYGGASLANDGNTNTQSQTDYGTAREPYIRPYWGVDFGRSRTVFAVKLLSSDQWWQFLKDFKIVVGNVSDAHSPLNAVCADYLSAAGTSYVTFTCEDTMSGRYLYVVNGPHFMNYLSISEVVIDAFNYTAAPALMQPWWAVDFEVERAVAGVVIQTQTSSAVQVRVGLSADPLQNAVCGSGTMLVGVNNTITCATGMVGRYLSVIGAGNSVLLLNEVRVAGAGASACCGGTYKPLVGNFNCTACPAFSVSVVGATVVTQCSCSAPYLNTYS